MNKYHIVVDIAKCVGCYNCLMACKDEFVDNDWAPYTRKQQKHDDKWVNPVRSERGKAPYTEICFVPKLCQHCENPPCGKAAPGAVTKRPDGVVLLDVYKAKGNQELVKSCPFGAIQWNEELKVAQKCTLCAHLLDNGWEEPRCVQACPLRALSIVKCSDTDWEAMAIKDGLESLYKGNHKPKVMYKNLHRYNKCFISGAAAYDDGGIEKAATNATAILKKDGALVESKYVDFLGEFKFDKLAPNSGTYTVEISMPGCKTTSVEVEVAAESPDAGVIKLEKI